MWGQQHYNDSAELKSNRTSAEAEYAESKIDVKPLAPSCCFPGGAGLLLAQPRGSLVAPEMLTPSKEQHRCFQARQRTEAQAGLAGPGHGGGHCCMPSLSKALEHTAVWMSPKGPYFALRPSVSEHLGVVRHVSPQPTLHLVSISYRKTDA